MSPDYVVELMKGLMTHIMMIAMPLLLTGMVVGLLVSLFQAVTSLQEQTLTFVPKLVAVVISLAITAPWIGAQLVRFTTLVFEGIH